MLVRLSALSVALTGLLSLTACADHPSDQVVHYACRSGQQITVDYRGADTAIVEMRPRTFVMHAAKAPVGRRYVGNQLQWAVQRDRDTRRGTLFANSHDGVEGDIAEQCHETGRE